MFGPYVVCYLFLGGAGAGACLIMACLGLLVPNTDQRFDGAYRRLFIPGYVAGIGALVLGAVCLILDLGRADRLVLLLTAPEPTVMVVGAYSLAACVASSLVALVYWCAGATWRIGFARLAQVAVIAASLMTMLYTGFLLQGVHAVPLWASGWLPVLFALSALSCGIALLLLTGHFANSLPLFRSVFRRLVAVDAVAIAAEAVAAALFVASAGTLFGDASLGQAVSLGMALDPETLSEMLAGPDSPYAIAGQAMGSSALAATDASQTLVAAAASVRMLLAGPHAWVFWVGFAAVGLVAPFVLETVLLAAARCGRRFPPAYSAGVALLVLAGGFALRFAVVAAGIHPVAM